MNKFYINIVSFTLLLGQLLCKENADYEQELIEKLPPVYNTDYSRCGNETNGRYCIAHINLRPIGIEPPFWKLVEERKKSRNHYDRSSVHRGLCLLRSVKSSDVERSINKILAEEFLKYNLTHDIYMLECKDEPRPTSKLWSTFGYLSIIYLALTILSTIYDNLVKNTNSKDSKLREWLLYFSITSNWNKLVNHKKSNPDYERLEFFQGIRFFNMNLVLFCHNKLVWAMVFLKNPDIIENIFNNKLYLIPICWDFFVVQTFFLISSWLLTNQILEIHKKNGEFTIRDGGILLFNRVMRYFPTLAIVTIILLCPLTNSEQCEGTLMFGFIRVIQKGCLDNWWMTLLQVNNLAGGVYKICNIGTWYLSIDTQYYLTTLIVLYVILKKNWNPAKIMAAVIFVALGTHAFMMHMQNLQSIQWLNIETLKRHQLVKDPVIESQYFSFYSSWGTSLIGTCLGMVYFYTKHNKTIQPFEQILYPVAFSTLPCIAILVSLFPFGPSIPASIVGSLLKPLWSLGIGLGFLGISRNAMPGIFGLSKTVCQNKYAVLMGNFSYSTYLVHFQIVFMKGLYGVIEVNIFTVIFNLARDFLSSWIAGIVFAVLVEQPGVNVLKNFLPQIKKKRSRLHEGLTSDDNENEIICRNDILNNNFKNK